VKRTFKELPEFTRLVKSGKISDELLKDLQNDIMTVGGDTIGGTGGLIKIRAPGSGRGKSGGLRVIYADYAAQGVAVLVVAYSKNVKVELSGEEKRILRGLKQRLDKQIHGD